ncbi:MAG: MBL fold metallo-hydrolase [Verrucomicrobiota bacterium]
MLEFSVLGSGSSGNAALVRSSGARILVDAGLSARQLNRRLEALGVPAETLDGILITHEHGDHVRGLDVFCRGLSLPIYCNPLTREVLRDSVRESKSWKLVQTGSSFSINDLEIETFPVAHDATDPMGFVFASGGVRLGMFSDVGYVTNLMRSRLADCDGLFVEANYDEQLLIDDLKRPWATKQRIQSRHGHLSNTQTAELVAEVATTRLTRVVLGHLSQDCNEPGLAANTIRDQLVARNWATVEVCCAGQKEPTPLFRLEPSESGTVAEEALMDWARAALEGERVPLPSPEPVDAVSAESTLPDEEGFEEPAPPTPEPVALPSGRAHSIWKEEMFSQEELTLAPAPPKKPKRRRKKKASPAEWQEELILGG